MHKLRPNQLKDYVLHRWAEQYRIDRNTHDFKEDTPHSNYGHYRTNYKDKLLVYKMILDLSESCVPKDINDIIGNNSWPGNTGWTEHRCCFCNRNVLATDVISDTDFYAEGDYDTSPSYLCEYCVSEATDIFKLG